MSNDLAELNAARLWWQDHMPYIGRVPTDAEVLEAYAEHGAGTSRREVTRGLVWLPRSTAYRWRFSEVSESWSLTRETWRILGRLGWIVVTEKYEVHSPGPERKS
jgi:hypothetical protein